MSIVDDVGRRDGPSRMPLAARSGARRTRVLTVASIVSLVAGLATVAVRPLPTRAAVGDISTFWSGYGPQGVVQDAAGNVYIASDGQNSVFRVDPSNNVTTYAGTGTAGFSGDGGPATSAQLNTPEWLGFDAAGDLLIADYGNNAIRAVTPSGTISTVAGNGTAGYTGDGGAAVSAELNTPQSVTGLAGGGFLISDTGNNVVRKVDASGTITTVAGNGTAGYSGDGGSATSAQLNEPLGMVVDSASDLIIADCSNGVVRKVDTTGKISTFAGNGTQGFAGDGGPATGAEFNCPDGLQFSGGTLYVGDYGNGAVRKINASGTITTIAGQGHGGNISSFNRVTQVWLGNSGQMFFADWWDGAVYVEDIADLLSVTASAPVTVVSGQTFAYTLAVTNPGGAGNATGVSLSDTLPASVAFVSATATSGTCSPSGSTVTCSLGQLAEGASDTVTITVTAPSTTTQLSNTATVSANETDPALADNTATSTTLVNGADLSVTGSGSPNPVPVGKAATYTLTVGNGGAADATNVVLTNSLTGGVTVQSASATQGSCTSTAPTISCSLGTLAKGATATVSITVMPPANATAVSDTATVAADQPDPNSANNSASVQLPIAVIGYVTIYNDLNPYDGTHGITAGPDGNIWYTAQNTGMVGRMATDGTHVVQYPTTYGDTRYIAPGPDGALWFTEHGGAGAIGRITTAGVMKEFPVPTTYNGPWSITAGPDGNMWFTEDGGKIGRITMAGKITEYPIPTPHALPDHITKGPDGQLWFTESSKDKVASISTTGHIREFQLAPGSSPSGIVTGPDGHLWITEQTGPPGKIAQLTISGSKISVKAYTVPDPQSLPYNIIVGPDKNLWFTDPGAGGGYFVGRLGRMTTSGVFTMFDPQAPQNKSMIDLTAGPGDGRIWYGLYWSSQVANMVAK